MSDRVLADEMQAAATAVWRAMDDRQRAAAGHAFDDDPARRWIEYRPRPRPGTSLAELDGTARKAAHRLLATALSPHAYAQAMTVLALEEVLDRQEGWRRGRHSDDYRVAIFGTPGDDPWGWRFEGHHLSVSMTVVRGRISPVPLFLGANPARVRHGGRTVLGPLAAEEELGRELLLAMSPAARRTAVVADTAPDDIRSATHPWADERLEPLGVARADLGPGARALLDQLVAFHLERLPATLAAEQDRRIAAGPVHFAWEGPPAPGTRHYYRVQADDLLIEYDNTSDDGNHAHTVLRRPRGDFGADLLARHLHEER